MKNNINNENIEHNTDKIDVATNNENVQEKKLNVVAYCLLAALVVMLILFYNDWSISSAVSDLTKQVNEIQQELAKPWYQFW